MARSKKRGTAPKIPAPRLTEARLRELVTDATVDCHDDSEQVSGLFDMIEDNLDIPFDTKVLGVEVAVESLELKRGYEIVAICRRGRHVQAISLPDLPLPRPLPEGWEWIEAYRSWAGNR